MSEATRRLFFQRSAMAASFFSLAALGASQFPQTQSQVPTAIESRITAMMSSFDRTYATQGRTAIEELAAGKNEHQAVTILLWIKTREHKALYDVMMCSLLDKRPNVCHAAYVYLAAVPHFDLKPDLLLLIAAQQSVEDPEFAAIIGHLVHRVELS